MFDHSVIYIASSDRDNEAGFFVHEGNNPECIAYYEEHAKSPDHYDSLDKSIKAMEDAKAAMEDGGYLCGDVLVRPHTDWQEMVLGRSLTPDELDAIEVYAEDEEMTDLALPQGKGRRPSELQYGIRRAILDNTEFGEVFTTPELASRIDRDIAEVRRSLVFFQSRGVMDYMGTERVAGKQGKPAKKWKRAM